MMVHIYGLPVDMDPILELAERHGLAVIEDAAELIGGTYKGKPCGSFGNISTFSFYPNKHITTGEGGMVVTDDPDLAERCRSLRNLCFQPKQRFVHEELGWNFRMTNLQAALGIAQLEKLDTTVARKKEIGRLYGDKLQNVSSLSVQAIETPSSENIYWVYGITIDPKCGLNATHVSAKLASLGIGTRPFFYPIHQQPIFLDRGMFADLALITSEYLSTQGLYLPSGLALTNSQLERAAQAVIETLSES